VHRVVDAVSWRADGGHHHALESLARPVRHRLAGVHATIGLLAATAVSQSVAELATEDAVDDEVDGRVGGNDDVTDVEVVIVDLHSERTAFPVDHLKSALPSRIAWSH